MYRAICSREHLQSLARVLPLRLRDVSLEDLGYDVPELVVLGLEQDHQAARLRVERARHRQRSVVDNLFDPVVRDGGGLLEVVNGAAVGDGVLKAHLAGHCRSLAAGAV